MFINILFIILLYIFTLVIIFLSNIFYLMPWEFTWLYQNKIFFSIVIILYLLFIYLLFVLIRWVYTKKLHKNYLYVYVWFWIFLVIFYFWYYKQLDNKVIVSESEFVTKLQNVDVADENNWLIQMDKLLKENDKSILAYEDNNFYNTYDCILNWKWRNCDKVKLENILENYKNNYSKINVFNNEMKNVVDNDYFKEKTNVDEFVSMQSIPKLTRISLFTAIYEINNWDKNRAVITLLTYKKLWDKLLNWDNSLVWMIVWITIVNMSIENINYVLDNYDIDEENLKLLKNKLSTNYNSKEIFSNAIKMEYNMNKHWLEKMLGEWKVRTSIMFDLDEYTNEQRKAWLSVINWEESYYKTIPVNYFKRSFVYRFLWGVERFSNTWYIEDLEKLNTDKKALLDKIESKLAK